MSSRNKDSGVSAYQPIRSKALTRLSPEKAALSVGEVQLNNGKHSPSHTKPQFKKRKDKRGNIKLIKIR
jgi:hypothetical protein|tara:strand:+ start:55 stop:261 length:207 start_codon:yes stop_codon:yes gene_type:complete